MRIHDALARGNALVCFVTAGDPPISQLPDIIAALNEGGADIIEVGIPFSDPIADGPTIQASSQRALDRGIRVDDIFETLAKSESRAPIVLMGYTNTAMRIGFERFAVLAKQAGAAGVILSDLAPDDSEEWRAAAGRHGLDTIFLAAPTSTDDRLREVAAASSGFVYCVSRTGVTGADSQTGSDVGETVSRIRTFTPLPICVGFGVSTHQHVKSIWDCAEGAIVGSYLVNLLHESWDDGRGRAGFVSAVKALKGA